MQRILPLNPPSHADRAQHQEARLGSLADLFLRSLVKQKDALAKEVCLEESHTEDFHPLAKKIVPLLPDHKILTLHQIVNLTKGKPSTLKLRLKELVEKGYLVPKGQGRGAHCVRVNFMPVTRRTPRLGYSDRIAAAETLLCDDAVLSDRWAYQTAKCAQF